MPHESANLRAEGPNPFRPVKFSASRASRSFPRPAPCRKLVFRLVHKLFPNKSNDLSPRNFFGQVDFPCGESRGLRTSPYRQASPDVDGCKAFGAGANRIGTQVPGRGAKVRGPGRRRGVFGSISDGIGTMVVAWWRIARFAAHRARHPPGRTARGRRQGVSATARCKDRVQAPDAFLILAPDLQKQRARATVPGPRQRQVMHPRPTHLCSGVYTHMLWSATKSCDAGSISLNALGARFPGGHAPDGPAHGQASRKAVTAASNARGLSACSQCPAPGILTNRACGKSALIRLRCAPVT